jgi:myb proto-oncogene protein
LCFYINIYALSCEQDKWRNINVTAIWGSRQKAKLALKKNLPPPKTENNHHTTSTAIVQYNPEVAAPKPLAVSGGISTSKEQISRL